MFDDELVPADLLLALTHAFGLMALCTLLFGRIQRCVRNAVVRNCATGLVLGTATAIAMLQPFFTVNGFQVDGRNMFIAVASAFGGVTAMIVAAVMGILMRIAIGGAGVPFGTGAILIICILGALWAHVTRKEGKRGWQSWVLLGALLSVPLLVGLLVLQIALPTMALLRIVPDVVTALVFGKMFEAELRRGDRERKLDREASTDPLTGLPNRRAMTAFVDQLSAAQGQGMALLMIDADHFKAINDTHGHDVGDEVLKTIATTISGTIREGDFAARVGGEEFVVLMQLNQQSDGYTVADRLRKAISRQQLIRGRKVMVTVSIGGTRLAGEPFDFSRAYAKADAALYEAKQNGRDRTVFA